MGLAAEMKNLSEDILASFKNRIKENEELVSEVQKTLDGFRKDHQDMANILKANASALRNGLANGEKERLNSYNELMNGIQSTISTIQQEVVAIQTSTLNLINEFATGRSQMAEELNQTFVQNRTDRMQDEKARLTEFNALMKDINADIKNIKDEVAAIFKNTNEMLATFDKEHHEMSDELKAELSRNLAERVEYTRALLTGFQKRLSEISMENQKMAQNLQKALAKGEVERIKEYNGIMKGIHAAIKGIQKEVQEVQKATSGMLKNYANDREGAVAEWNKMQVAIAKIRKTGVVEQPKQAEKKELKDGGIKGVKYPLVSDFAKTIAENFDVLAGYQDYNDEGEASFVGAPVAYRGLFLIDKKGMIRHQVVNDLPLGRSIDEAIRIVDALQFFEENGEVCPANWKKGEKAMKATQEGVASYLAAH